MKSQKGMGHITTILCIIAIILLIVGFIHIIKNQVQEQNIENHETDMLTIQGRIKVLAQEATINKNEEILKGGKLENNMEDEIIKKILDDKIISQDEENFSKYYILSKEDIEEMGLNNIKINDGYYIVNYATYEIIFSEGIKLDGNKYYKLTELEELKKKKEEKEPNNTVVETQTTEEEQNQEQQ